MKGISGLSILLLCLLGASAEKYQCPPDEQRIDCHPDADESETSCSQRGCLWCPSEQAGAPSCFLPQDHGYQMIGEPISLGNGWRVKLGKSGSSSYFGEDSFNLTADFLFDSDYRVHIKFTDGTPRFEMPISIYQPKKPLEDSLLDVEFSNDPVFSFKVTRKSSGVVLFDTSIGGLTFSKQFLQIATKIPSTNAYGIGENCQHAQRHNFTGYTTMALWARDQAPIGLLNSYGVQPYYTVVEDDGNAHSVAFVNSNAQEFALTPTPAYVYRTIGGILDMYIFAGPTPENTAQQFSEAVGRQPIPPYWGLGFILSRWGYDKFENMKAARDRTAAAGIPQDVQVGDIDIMERRLDFTVSKENFAELPEYVKSLKKEGIKFVTILDPFISINEQPGTYPPFDIGEELGVWMKDSNGRSVVGDCWPGLVYYPDYTRYATKLWWKNLIIDFKNLLDWDGLWIDMNEPANWWKGDRQEGCANNSINDPPYVPAINQGQLYDNTLCPDHQQDWGLHYDLHNLYGYTMSVATYEAMRETLRDKRGFVLTRSQSFGTGQYAAHWLGDNFSEWPEIHYSIIALLNYNSFAMPYAGSDICGFIYNATEEMCTRWHQVGAFYPFSRNHNIRDTVDQDPGIWSEVSRNSTRNAYLVRYTLLPYLYSLFFHHRLEGNTVARALWQEYPTDHVALGIDRQFLWGSALMISPVLEAGADTVNAYFPDDPWYSYYDGAKVVARREHTTLNAPIDFVNVHVRGGYILPTQEPAMNTEASRMNPFGLIVALDDSERAAGDLYYDDGVSVDPQDSDLYYEAQFSYNLQGISGRFDMTILKDNYEEMSSKTLDTIRLLGSRRQVITAIIVLVEGEPNRNHFSFSVLPSGEIDILNLKIPMNKNAGVRIEFS